jgi:hypothetical protein
VSIDLPVVPTKGERWTLVYPKGDGYEVEVSQVRGDVVSFIRQGATVTQNLEVDRFRSHFRLKTPAPAAVAETATQATA